MAETRVPTTAVDRRRFVLGAAGALASAGLGGALALPDEAAAAAHHARRHHRLRHQAVPSPIPGGLKPGVHVWGVGPAGRTLPFSHFVMGGLDLDASTITDFSGSVAVAYLVGTARGSDGATYNLETDVRAYSGRFVAADGSTHHGKFAFI
jgi:hypothetical protein